MKTTKALLAVSALIIFIINPVFSCWAADESQPVKKPAAPIQIEADHMLSNQQENSVFFSGKVEAAQGDVTIHADEITVYYKETNSSESGENPKSLDSSRKIQRLYAVGNVEIIKEKWVATGDSAEFFEEERKVVLTGNTKVWQDNNLITGDKFIMYLDEGKSVFERSSEKNERVKAFFYPDAKPSE